MRSTRRAWLAAIAASGSLAGCISGDGNDDGSGGDGAGDGSGGMDDGGGSDDGGDTDGGMGDAATVQVAEHDEYGEILVDSEGMTLYMFDPDAQGSGASNCSGDCLSAWPALTVDGEATAGDGVDADLTTFERSDTGDTQVAADGWPLYYFANDSEAGQANGQGLNGVWWVLRPDGTPVRADVQVSEHDTHGEILVDSEGMTLYMFDSDEQGAGSSTCSGDCASAWPPLTVEDGALAGANVEAELTTFERDDGSTQVAANGWPLYYFQNDEAAGDANGQGINDVWWVLDPSGAPIRGGNDSSSESSNGGDDTTY